MTASENGGGDVASEGKYVFCPSPVYEVGLDGCYVLVNRKKKLDQDGKVILDPSGNPAFYGGVRKQIGGGCGRPKAECTARRAGSCRSLPPVFYKPVVIPDDGMFLRQWYNWTRWKVSRRFKRDRDRIPDTVQRVCTRLLQKEFTARWFYKHLKDELVTRTEAERILGHGQPLPSPKRMKDGTVQTTKVVQLVFMSGSGLVADLLQPIAGDRTDPNSIWRLADVLKHGQFDFERYFYSMQSHTIDSDHMLRFLGYPPGSYTMLQSLWRQDRLLPYELTEHDCPRGRLKVNGAGNKAPPSTCPECSRGLALLRSKGITLDMVNYPRWEDPAVVQHVRKMRWNDSQLSTFLRRWNKQNEVYATPSFIMRPVSRADEKPQGIDAGLLKYAQRIIDNEVINDFKHLTRTDDMAKMVYNDGMSPGSADADTMAFDLDSEEGAEKIVCDVDAVEDFRGVEHRSDISSLLDGASLSKEETEVLSAVDLMDVTVRDYARRNGLPVARVHRIRSTALRKLKSAVVGPSHAERVMQEVCDRHGCSADDVLGLAAYGSPVLARTELFSSLYSDGMSEDDISCHFDYPREKVMAAVQRGLRSSGT